MPQPVAKPSVTVWRYDNRLPAPAAMSQARHRLILDRLAAVASFPVPPVIGDFDGWMVTGPLAGGRADRPDRHPDPDDLVVAVGAGLRALHDLEPGHGLGGNHLTGWDVVAARATVAVDRGLVDPRALPQPYARYEAKDLLAMFLEGRPEADDADGDPVLCHGRPTMGCFHVDRGRFCGLDRLDSAFVGDRHVDLAVIHRSVQNVMGPEAVFRLYESYGQDPRLPRLEHYILGSHLTDRLHGVDVSVVGAEC